MVTLYVAIGLGILLLGLGIYPWLGDIFPKFTAEELGTYRILYLMTLVNAAIMFPARSLAGVADAQQRFTIPGIIAVVTSATNALGTVLLLVLGVRSVGLITLSITTGIIALLCNVMYCFVGLRARISLSGWNRCICRGIFIFSFWMFLNQLINMLNAGTGNYIVAITQGPAAAGIYTNGLRIYGIYYLLAGGLSALFLPRVVHMVISGASPQDQTDAMARLGRAQIMILGAPLLVLIFFGGEFFRLWVGHIHGADAELSYHIALCLVIPQTFGLVQALGWQISQARDALRQRVLITGFNSLLFIAVSFFVCLYYGIATQAVWAAVSILIQLAMLNLIHYRGMGLHIRQFYVTTFRGAIPAALVMSAVCCAILHLIPSGGWGYLLLKLALFLPFYAIIIARLYATPEERRLFRLK
ncbi:MAG: oligosaccharide flippase family protein, partial [Akkermansia sp.]|nr:oligosaccharide flippase family protein [Akkermansia sp.]